MKILCQLVNCSKRIILISLAIGVVAAIIIFFVIVKDGNWRQNEMEEMRDSFDTGIMFAEQVEEQADTEEEQDPMVEIWYEPEDGKTRDQDLSFRELPDAQRETGIASVSGGSAHPELNPEEDLNNNTIPDKWEEQFSLTDQDAFSDEDGDGFPLIQEYRFKTSPVDPLSHPKYITRIYHSSSSMSRLIGLELVSVDMTKPEKEDWVATFNVLRNNRKRSEFVHINVGTFKNNNVDFSLIDIEVDEKTKDPVAYVQRVGKQERIPCYIKQTVYAPVQHATRVIDPVFSRNRRISATVGSIFELGTTETGEERYKVISTDPETKIVVVESVGATPERITILSEPLIPTLDKDSDWDKDGFTLAEEFAARTDPSDLLSHPKYITRIGVFSVDAQQVRFVDGIQPRAFTVSVGSIFELGTAETGEEEYKVVSADPDTKIAVVESMGAAPERITILPVPLIPSLNKDLDLDADGFTLAEEYEAQTDPFDPISHPKYITRTIASHVASLRIEGLELVSIDTSNPDKKEWFASFNVLQNNKKHSIFVWINNQFKSNNRGSEQYDFTLVDIEMDEKTGNPVAYIRHANETELIACRIKQPVHYLTRLRLINPVLNLTVDTQVGSTFKLGTTKTGEEEYKIVSADPETKEVVVESTESPRDFSSVLTTSISDEDSDGFVLEEELMAHTDPSNPLSHPKYISNLYIFSDWDTSTSMFDERYDIRLFDPIQCRILRFKSDVEIGSTFKLGSARTGEETYRIDSFELNNFFSFKNEIRVKSVKNKYEEFLLRYEPESPRWKRNPAGH